MIRTQFFKILDNKIKAYDKAAKNPFNNTKLVIVWVEDPPETKNTDSS